MTKGHHLALALVRIQLWCFYWLDKIIWKNCRRKPVRKWQIYDKIKVCLSEIGEKRKIWRKTVNFRVIFTWSQDFLSAVNGSTKEHQPCILACCQFMCKIKDGSIDIPSLTAMKSYCCWYPSRYKIHLSNLLPFLFTQWQNMIPYSLPFSISRPFSISKQSMSKSHYKAPGGLSVKNVKTQWLTSGEWGYPSSIAYIWQ